MFKTIVKHLLVLTLFTVFAATSVFAQATISIGTVDAGPYSPGSTIAVPFHVNDATGCISQSNVFTVEMSDASGSFASPTVVATSPANTFYANFLNATVPNGTPVGVGYTFRVKASSAGVATSSASNAVSVNNTAGPTAVAAAASVPTITNEVFGQCNGPASGYDIFDNSSGATTLTASFYNETTQTPEVSNQSILGPAGYHFTANPATYTVFVKAINSAGKISTKAYLLINNQVNSSIGIQGNGTVCISPGPGGNAPLTYLIDVNGVNGIQKNYPGNLYTFSWGDGTPNTILTLCEIIAMNGQVVHPYTRASCGNASGQNNRFQVDISISNAYCNNIGSRVTSYALILTTPSNIIRGPGSTNICTGTTLTFTNSSDPGVDPNSSSLNCPQNTNARYTWYVDGVLQTSALGVPISTNFTYTFSARGTHVVTLRALNSNGGACTAADATFTLCVQNAPTPAFTLSSNTICLSSPFSPTDASVVDNICTASTYTWKVYKADGVTTATGITFAGGTNYNSVTPQFIFAAEGIYQLELSISSASCGNVTTPQKQTLTVEAPPTATLSNDLTLCGAPQTVAFTATSVQTGAVFTGTPTTGATTYTWDVTPAGTWSFAPGSTLHSQYPQIIFNNIGTYTVTVIHTNSCGTASDSQNITFQQAPVPYAGPAQIVCESTGVVHLSGTVSGGAYDALQWSRIPPGTGTFTNGSTLNADYTPTAADWARGSVTLRLTTTANALPAPCNQVTSDVIITLVRTTSINSAPSKTICSGDNVNYTITSNNDALTPAPTFTWTATVTSGAVTGFTASGITKTITDVLINSNPTVTATVTYHIIPTTNGCAGTPFDYVVTIPAVPVITAVAANPAICANSPAGITMSAASSYTWTVSAAGSGATPQSTPTTNAFINQTLVNNTASIITVTYNITPYNVTGCPGTPVPVSVDVYPAPTTSNAGPAQNLCGATSTVLAANSPVGTETGKWTVVTGNGLTFTNDTDPHTTVSGLVDGGNYTLMWTITNVSNCSSSSNMNISVTPATVGGTTAAAHATTVCYSTNADVITLSGETGTILRWEKSTDGINFTTVTPANTSHTLSYSGLLVTTYYRAVVQSGSCNPLTSSVTTITVNPLTPQATINGSGNQSFCAPSVVTLTGNDPGPPYIGQWTQTGGPTAGVTITNPTNPTTTITGLTGGTSFTTYAFTWTINGQAPCGPTTASVNVTYYAASVGGTTATTDPTTVCSGNNAGAITLTGQLGSILRWERSTDGGGTWTSITNTATSLSYANVVQTTQFRAAVQNNGSCNIAYSTITIITVNLASPIATVGADQRLCNASFVTLTGNDPGVQFPARWTQTLGPAVIINNPNSYQTTVTGLTGGNTYAFTWTIDGLAPCGPSSASTTIINDAATVPGITSTVNPTTVCSGSNGDVITLSGETGTILRWEKSTDGTNFTTVTPANTSHTLSYSGLLVTTYYRAVVQSGVCTPPQNSSVTKITVNPPAPIANAGNNQIQCNAATITLTGNDPGTFAGLWTQTSGLPVTITNPTNYQTTVTGLTGGNNYTFTWTITPLLPCTPTSSQVTITNNADVVASFNTTPKTGCGNLTVRFTNTSNNQVGANFQWNFGDGGTSTAASPQHTFAQRTDGRDTTYYISLKVVGNCIDRPATIDSVLVRPATPIARILPASTNGCGNFAIDVRNTSPGNNLSYDYYLYDGTTLVQKITSTDKNDVVFNPITTVARKVFTLYMIATGYCGTTNETTHIPIAISPADVVAQMFLQNDLHASCAPLNTTFVNNSFGGNNFYYTIYDANNNIVDKPTASTTSLPYTFTKPGTYYVTITAVNTCGSNESPRTRIDVYPTPKPSFVADVTTACKNLRVTFTNNTDTDDPVTPATSLVYDWDFGDGSTHSALFAPVHSYKTSGTYTVTLTATNTTSGCSDVFIRQSYIIINAPPLTAFSVQPDSIINIPSYTFSFVDKTKGNPTAWKWQFSDGQISNKQNPIITFADTGTYKVTFTTYSAAGCDSTITGKVRVDGVPGQLFLPNAFMPTSLSNDLTEFRAKGSGIKQWHLQIFNIYGQLLWETTKLTAKGEPAEGWDGTFKGAPMPQGVYQWQASALFINGNEWKGNAYGSELPKRVGSIHLLK